MKINSYVQFEYWAINMHKGVKINSSECMFIIFWKFWQLFKLLLFDHF